jgi:hypothetical protein
MKTFPAGRKQFNFSPYDQYKTRGGQDIFPQAYEQQQQAPSSSDGACILAGYGPKQPHKYSLISQRSSPTNGEY